MANIKTRIKTKSKLKAKSPFHTVAQDKVRMGKGLKNLTYKEARAKYPYKKSMGDVRGFGYDKKTGQWEWI